MRKIMGAKLNEIYKCAECGLAVETTDADECTPECCGKPMTKLEENSVDASREKHVPVVASEGSGILVKVGETPHPMTPEHHISWIEVINGSYVNRYHLKPGEAPQAAFYVPLRPGLQIRAYCNLHGLWKK